MSDTSVDVSIIGGGIVGMSTAMHLTSWTQAQVMVVEAEAKLAAHQTGHNSGVIHSGLYYKPGSLKARNCTQGREDMYRFCALHGIAHERCGKLVVATSADEVQALDELERRGRANGLVGLRRLAQAELVEYEPNVTGIAGLFVAETGIVDYVQVVAEYARQTELAGGLIRTEHRVQGVRRSGGGFQLQTTGGTISSRALVNCAGLQSDRVARLCGIDPALQIIPFRGEYYQLVPGRAHLVRNLIYPVPDPKFPFLGVHFTRMIGGGVEAGPNAVLAFRREGYRLSSISLRDVLGYLAYPGFWRMAGRYWRTGISEFRRSLSKQSFTRSLQKLVPAVGEEDLVPGGAGVRAQAVDREGRMVDDFRLLEADRMVHVLNAPSPAATASLSIGRAIAEMACNNFGLAHREVRLAQ